jgi:hypothetical protein
LLLLPLAVPLILKQGAAPILIVLAFVAVSILIGHLMGGPPESLRPALAATLAGRWVAPALVLANENGWTRQLAPILLTYVLGGALLMIVYQRWVKAHMAPADAVLGAEPKLAGTPRSRA